MKLYKNVLTAEINDKGILDIDPVKGCSDGMKAHEGGCYNNCYANKIASFRAIDFSRSVIRTIQNAPQMRAIAKLIKQSDLDFVRMGTMGDPSYSWENSLSVADFIKGCGKSIVIISKHWKVMTDRQIELAGHLGVILNTSVSGMDTEKEITHRLKQYERYKKFGKSILRIVSAKYNIENEKGKEYQERQAKVI